MHMYKQLSLRTYGILHIINFLAVVDPNAALNYSIQKKNNLEIMPLKFNIHSSNIEATGMIFYNKRAGMGMLLQRMFGTP